MLRRVPPALFVLALAASSAFAQPAPLSPGDVVIGRREIVRSTVLGEDRPILVSVPTPPPDAPRDPTARYPVLVVLDGEWSFEHTVAAARFLGGNGLLPPTIVVGVVNVDRGRDLMPRFEGGELAAGPSDRFLSFLVDELVPHVDRTYPTLPFRALVGHSNGGMFSLYALMRRPGAFAAHFVMSPSFGQDERFVTALERFLGSRSRLDAFVYLSVGDEEADISVGAIRMAKAIEMGAPPGLTLHYEYFPGESHGSVAHKSVYRGLELLGYKDGAPATGAGAFLPAAELRRRAWARRFGSDFAGLPPIRASVAAPILRLLGENAGAGLRDQYQYLRATEKDAFRFEDVELENLEGWLAARGRPKDAQAVRELRGPAAAARASATANEYGAGVDLARGLVARYALDGHAREAAGGAAGQVQGAVPVEDRRGRAASAFRFDGTDDRIQIPSPPRLATGGSISVAAWVRPRGRVAYGAWVSKATQPYGSQWRVGFASKADTQWGFTVFNGRWTDYWVAQAPVADGAWTHVLVTADQTTGEVRYYVNGQPAGGSSALVPFLPSALPLYVGFQQDDGVYYAGDVDDLRVWDRVLGSAEAEALFKAE